MSKSEPRRVYPDENDPGALRVELSLQGMSARGVAIVATERKRRPVRIVLSLEQAAELARRLQAVLAEV